MLAEMDAEMLNKLIESIHSHAVPLRIMHICGTHERTISRHGLRDVLPPEIEILSGPGCPVCVTPTQDIDFAIKLAKAGVIVVSFGDMMRVPGSGNDENCGKCKKGGISDNCGSLFDAKAQGCDVRMVYSIDDAIELARNNPEQDVVFFGIGFETTAPSNAAAVLRGLPDNFSILTSHKLVPPAMDVLIKDINVDAFIAPGHVCTIIGTHPFETYAEQGYPVVVAGFEAHDILLAIAMIQRQMKNGVSSVENGYLRAVDTEGNVKAQKMMSQAFDVVDVNWRGIGIIEKSGMSLKEEFAQFDAAKKYTDLYEEIADNASDIYNDSKDSTQRCMCAEILTARAQPSQCPMFAEQCTPKNPVGPCMVSLEGMCHNWYKYKRNSGKKYTQKRIYGNQRVKQGSDTGA